MCTNITTEFRCLTNIYSGGTRNTLILSTDKTESVNPFCYADRTFVILTVRQNAKSCVVNE